MRFDETMFIDHVDEIIFRTAMNQHSDIDKSSPIDQLQKFIESEIFTDDYLKGRLLYVFSVNDTYDEEMCVICYDDEDSNPDLKFTCFLPCKHSAVCIDCSTANACLICPLCKQKIDETVHRKDKEVPEWIITASRGSIHCFRIFS